METHLSSFLRRLAKRASLRRTRRKSPRSELVAEHSCGFVGGGFAVVATTTTAAAVSRRITPLDASGRRKRGTSRTVFQRERFVEQSIRATPRVARRSTASNQDARTQHKKNLMCCRRKKRSGRSFRPPRLRFNHRAFEGSLA